MASNHDPISADRADAVELTRGIRLAAIALVSAVVTATLVIGLGGAWLEQSAHASQASANGALPVQRTAG